MKAIFSLSLIALCLLAIGQRASAEMFCTFQARSTIEGNDKLSDHGFRVLYGGQVRTLEQRFGDGSWHSYGEVLRFDRPGFTVYLHLATDSPIQSQSLMLSVQTSGTASLYIHYGRTGGAWNSNRAWLYHGSCTKTVIE